MSSVVQNFHYLYDRAGNRTSEQIDSAVNAATVNTLDQLTALSPSGPIHFAGTLSEPANVTVNGVSASVDAANNFSADIPLAPGSNTVAVVATDGSGNATTKHYSYTVASGTGRTLTYDLNGAMTNNGAGQTYSFDAASRLTKITYADNSSSNFTYNGAGQWVKIVEKDPSGTVTSEKDFAWCPGDSQPCEERDASNNVTKRFYGQGEQIGGVNYWFTRDHLGSVREMTDSTGAVRARYDYDPFGRRTLVSGTDLADFGFQGMYYHQASGLYFTTQRFYDPVLGRFVTRDPIGEAGGINLYQFVNNNPTNYVDPTGRYATLPVVGVAAGTTLGVAGGAALALAPAAAYGYWQLGNVLGEGISDALGYNDPVAPLPKLQRPPPKPPCNNKQAPPGFPGDDPQEHHNYPQQFRNFFETKGINIDADENLTKMPQQWHVGEDISIHSNGYNGMWEDFIEKYPNASPEQIKTFQQQATNQLGFGTLPPPHL